MTPKVPEYEKHAQFELFNTDVDLKPIRYDLPSPPNYKRIEGYGLKPEKQFWVHKPMPPKLAKLHRQLKADDGKTELTPRMKVEIIERNPEYYAEEIIYIQKEWDRRENGHWFFNNGVPTYITGDHYFFLQWWYIDGRPPEYRNRDRRWFLFWKMTEDDLECYGFNNPKQRREGATIKVCCVRYNRASMLPFFTTGLQSKDLEHAAEVHTMNLLENAKRIPFFFKPVTDNSQNETSTISFFSPTGKEHPDRGQEALNSLMDFRDSGILGYDGYKRWLIHNDETGKTKGIADRIDVQIPILTNLIPGSRYKGKMINTSTIGQMTTDGADEFKKVCDNSDYHVRNDNGQTITGLYTFFQGVQEGMEGRDKETDLPYIDKYGMPNVPLIESFCNNKREALRMSGNVQKYILECQQYPMRYADCWKSSAKACPFNLLVLEDRLEFYRNGNEDKIQGFFEWENGKRDGKVRFVPSVNGHAYISWNFPEPNMSNRMMIDEEGNRIPINKNKFIAGGDPYRLNKTKRKGSDGGAAIFMKYNYQMDEGKDTHEWESYRFIYTYRFRPRTLEDFYEDQLMACVYFGCQMDWETNVSGGVKYFDDRGYGGYNYYKYDPKKGRFEEEAGSNTNTKEIADIFRVTESYIEHHGHRERHDELCLEWKKVEDDLNPFDLAVAAGKCLLRANEDVYSADDDKPQTADIGAYFKTYSYDKIIT